MVTMYLSVLEGMVYQKKFDRGVQYKKFFAINLPKFIVFVGFSSSAFLFIQTFLIVINRLSPNSLLPLRFHEKK